MSDRYTWGFSDSSIRLLFKTEWLSQTSSREWLGDVNTFKFSPCCLFRSHFGLLAIFEYQEAF